MILLKNRLIIVFFTLPPVIFFKPEVSCFDEMGGDEIGKTGVNFKVWILLHRMSMALIKIMV